MKFKTVLTIYLVVVFTFNFTSGTLFALSCQNLSLNKLQINDSKSYCNLDEDFEGINGCAVIFDHKKGQYCFYNDAMASTRVSPCSTFKIISTILGLKYGVLKDEQSTMHYNGEIYPIEVWNESLSLDKAFISSCVWYFRQVIDAVGLEKVERELNFLSYGNCDVSEWNGSAINSMLELNGFWLNSSLKISPVEQINVLCKIFDSSSKYDSKEIEVLKKIMIVKEAENVKIYGKTGSDGKGHAWFVGFKEDKNGRKYFAIYLSDNDKKDQISGLKAREIAFKILEKI